MTIRVDADWWKILFDDIYLLTDARTVCNDTLTRCEVDIFCRLLPFRHRDRILDLCGGHGRHSLELARRGYPNCTVVDYSKVLLEKGAECAQQRCHSVCFVQADARCAGLSSETCHHALILGNSLGYAPGEESDFKILAEALRVLKSGGWLLLDVANGGVIKENFTPNAWHEIESDIVVCRQRELRDNAVCARELVMHKQQGVIRDRTYCIRLYDEEALSGLLEKSGFNRIQIITDFKPHSTTDDLGFMNHRMILTARKP